MGYDIIRHKKQRGTRAGENGLWIRLEMMYVIVVLRVVIPSNSYIWPFLNTVFEYIFS